MSLTVSLPEDGYRGDVPLAATTRGIHTETIHRGTVVVAGVDGTIVECLGDTSQGTYIRSAAKPFQGMALVLTGAAAGLGLDQQDLAIACSSHSGAPQHVRAVLRLLAKAGLDPHALQCGIHPPLARAANDELIREGHTPTVLHNNCSGKHAGMAAVRAYMGWPLDTYRDPEHPLQQLNLETISAFSGVPKAGIQIAVDGCGVPTFYLPVAALAVAFARLANGKNVSDSHSSAAQTVRDAMLKHPDLIAGAGRFDTEFMEAADGTVVCKGGALGCEGVGLIGKDTGMGMKMSDGSTASIPLVTYNMLNDLGYLNDRMPGSLDQFKKTAVRNHAGTVTGSMDVVFDKREAG